MLKLDTTTPPAGYMIDYTTSDTSPGGNTHYARLAVRPIMDEGEWIVLANKYKILLKKKKKKKKIKEETVMLRRMRTSL